jgi:outer membrane protein assembly factor BamD
MPVPAASPRPLARSPFRTLGLAVAASALLLGAGCAGRGGPKDTAYVARDVDTLYTAAKERLDRGQAKQAAALFDEVERQHPYSPWARRAQLMSAFSYAYYLISLSYYEQISDVTRDQKITEQALRALTEVVRRYPQTEYARDAKLKIDLVNDHLAGKEMEIGRYYQRSGKWLAATLRFREVIDHYQQTSHTPEALYRLVESYLSLGIPAEAQKSAAVLGANYPGDEWYKRAYELINRHGPKGTA